MIPDLLLLTLKVLLTAMVLLGAIPLLVACLQFSLIGLHRFFSHYDKVTSYLPRVSIIVPAWNEGMVIGNTIDHLMKLDYPNASLRVYVVDDASTDQTPDVVKAKEQEYSGNVFHIRREKGGEGKAHTLNYGIQQILAEDWTEAVLIMDADVLFEADSLRKMARHLSDEKVGAVTAYIKEGSIPGNYLTKFIAFEYITAQAAARRAQNVMGTMACLAGGAQLHSRASLEAIGGRIDTSSLAEDTFTTFKTQIKGRRAIFEGNARVWAEEPGNILGLWKQRLRWARGNVQVTKQFKKLWFNRKEYGALGSPFFAVNWFAIFMMPLYMIASSVGLLALYFLDSPFSWKMFNALWIMNALTFFLVTLFSFLIDPEVAKRCWFQGVMFPGVISLLVILYTCFPPLYEVVIYNWLTQHGMAISNVMIQALVLFLYAWLSLCMCFAYLAKVIEKKGRLGAFLAPVLIYVSGYGALLCAVSLTSYLLELKGAEAKWDKTEKSGKIGIQGAEAKWNKIEESGRIGIR